MTLPPPESRFDAFYLHDHSRLCGYLHVRGATWEEARDIAHDTYVKLLLAFDTVESPTAWTRKVAANLLIDRQRSQTAQASAMKRIIPQTDAGYTQPVFHDAEVERVMKLLQTLPERQREIMAWTIDGYAPKEIAQLLGVSANSVSANLRLAKRRLRDLLGESESGGRS